MKQSEIRRIRSGGEKKEYGVVIWTAFLSALLMTGSILAFAESCVTTPLPKAVLLLAGVFGMASCGLARIKKQHPILRFAWLLPVFFMIGLSGMGNCIWGGLEWINSQIASWNALYEGGAALFPITATGGDSIVFFLFFSALIGELSWIFAEKRRIWSCCLVVLFWTAMMLIEVTFLPIACSFLLLGLLGVFLGEERRVPGRQAFVWIGAFAVLLLVVGFVTEGSHWNFVDTFREDTREGIHEARYGKTVLPEGEFADADRLHTGTDTVLTVQADQVKSLYLKAFVGGTYDGESGRWLPLSDATYAGDYAGILKWLKKRGFDPLTQTSSYYALGNEQPESNTVSLQIDNASREYTYIPVTASEIQKGHAAERRDETFVSHGLVGGRTYTFTEISGSRPSELTVAEDWVSEPETTEQQTYCDSESVYRNFVYDVYTRTTPSTRMEMEDLFWADYETENDGIYSALNHIRDVLKHTLSYTDIPETIPEGEDPVEYGLYTSHSGNSMLYASAAVQAFRAHGIPARYVEGYYLPSELLENSETGTAELTGQQSHAWVEVYFDGVGWLPVDVTPGYYYDAVSLRQMISTPDMVHKSAALDNGNANAAETTGDQMIDAALMDEAFTIAKNVGAIVLGVVAILLLLVIGFICLTELGRMVVHWAETRRYRQSEEREQVQMLENWIGCVLAGRGIYAHTGWHAEETDREVVFACQNIEAGEYVRVNQLLEKSLYGRMPLEAYEKRTLVDFLQKISAPVQGDKWKIRCRLRHIILWSTLLSGRQRRRKNAKNSFAAVDKE